MAKMIWNTEINTKNKPPAYEMMSKTEGLPQHVIFLSLLLNIILTIMLTKTTTNAIMDNVRPVHVLVWVL